MNRLLDILQEANLQNYTAWVGTSRLLSKMGMGKDDHVHLRAMLNRMYMKRIVLRDGVGSFKWRINVKEWDRIVPLSTPSSDNLIEQFDPEGASPVKAYVNKVKKSVGYSDHNASESETNDTPEAGLVGEGFKYLLGRIREVEVTLEAVPKAIATMTEAIASLGADVKKLKEGAGYHKVLEVKHSDGKVVKLKNVVLPSVFNHVLDLAQCRMNVLLVGPAGCGKSYIGELVAKSLGLVFGSISCSGGIRESHLLGRGVPNLTTGKNKFQGTEFLDIYEGGGLFLFDELDGSDPNLLLCVNTALANRYCNVPDRVDKPKAMQHDDFVCVATANTIGRGADRQYVGRNQLDEATIDRFRIGIVECDYDPVVEAALCPDDDLRTTLQEVRKHINLAGLRRVMSTRFMKNAYEMQVKKKWDKGKVLDIFFTRWSPEEKAKVLDGLKNGGTEGGVS